MHNASAYRIAVAVMIPFLAVVFRQPALAQNTFPGSGNVGIGTTSPSDTLELNTASQSNTGLLLLGSDYHFAALRASMYQWMSNVITQSGDGGIIYYGNGFVIAPWGSGGIRLDGSGNVGVTGNVTVSGNISAKYQDLAEWVPARDPIPSGSVVVLDSNRANSVVLSNSSYDTSVAGVVSAEPGIILGEQGEGKVKVATTGRVKVRVDATQHPVRIGDLLVSSDRPGLAMRSEPIDIGGRKIHQPGTLIGKALEPLDDGEGEILVLLSLQ